MKCIDFIQFFSIRPCNHNDHCWLDLGFGMVRLPVGRMGRLRHGRYHGNVIKEYRLKLFIDKISVLLFIDLIF